MAVSVEELGNIKILAGLDQSDLVSVAAFCSSVRVQPKQLVYQTGDFSKDIYFVKTGNLLSRRFSSDGKEVHFADIVAGEFFGELAAISQNPRLANVEAVSSCHLLKMAGYDFRFLLEKHPQLYLRFLKATVERSRKYAERIFEFSTMPVAARVRREILRLAMLEQSSGKEILISPAPSHYELASRTATHREAVSRELSNLNASHIIKTGRRTLRVNDIEQLEKMVLEDAKTSAPPKPFSSLSAANSA